MPRRLDKTLIDYLVIAISPALIMVLVGSLVLFLAEVFYQGNFPGRLQYILALFVVGAVGIARISIEDGRERAMLFALPLGFVALLAINKFVVFQGELLAPLTLLINISLIGIIWWSADRLTWDCTLIDEQEEDSGQGLLETVGLDRPDDKELQHEIAPAATEATLAREQLPAGWWNRFVERRRRPHAPGVWVVYFSLAALPLFGIGQIFLPRDNLVVRQYAFLLLCVYTGSGLGLLLSTSFLGLRRYLRQRHQEMPFLMVALWLGLGVAIVVGVMATALLLPRPNAEYAISELPFRVGSPDQNSSRLGRGPASVKEDRPEARAEPSKDEADKPTRSTPSDDTDRGQSDDARDSQTGRRDAQESNGNDVEESRDAAKSPRSPTGKPDQENGEPAEHPDSEHAPQSSQPDRQPPSETDGRAPHSARRTPRTPPAEAARPLTAKEQPPSDDNELHAFRPVNVSLPIAHWLTDAVKWLLYGALGVIGIYVAFVRRYEILAGLGRLIQQLLDLWHGLFGGGRRHDRYGDNDAASPRVPARRFAAFTDPFATGTAAHYSPEDLVRYTFEAAEAWAADRGHPRHPEQTPHEFARALSAGLPALADDAPTIAELYAQAAYAPGTLKSPNPAQLERFWQTLRTANAEAISPAPSPSAAHRQAP